MNNSTETITISVSELAKLCGVCENTARKLIRRKDFPKIIVGRRILIHKQTFLEWLKTASLAG